MEGKGDKMNLNISINEMKEIAKKIDEMNLDFKYYEIDGIIGEIELRLYYFKVLDEKDYVKIRNMTAKELAAFPDKILDMLNGIDVTVNSEEFNVLLRHCCSKILHGETNNTKSIEVNCVDFAKAIKILNSHGIETTYN